MLTVEEEEALLGVVEPVSADEGTLRMAQRRVGELLWLASRTRPDLMYLVALLSSKVTRDPQMVNLLGERALDYLAETVDYRLTFPNEVANQDLHVYTDSSFAPSSGRSHGSAAVFLNQGPISWRSARQQLVTLSTAESELIEAVDGAVLGLSCRGIISELLEAEPKIVIHLDNQSALALVHGQAGSWRTRHLRLRVHWLRERIASGEVQVIYEPGATQRADLGTKPFTRERLRQLVQQWGIRDARPAAKLLTVADAPRELVPGRDDEETTELVGDDLRQPRALPESTWKWGPWIAKLATLCQVCGAKAQEELGIEAAFPWEIYLLVLLACGSSGGQGTLPGWLAFSSYVIKRQRVKNAETFQEQSLMNFSIFLDWNQVTSRFFRQKGCWNSAQGLEREERTEGSRIERFYTLHQPPHLSGLRQVCQPTVLLPQLRRECRPRQRLSSWRMYQCLVWRSVRSFLRGRTTMFQAEIMFT